MLIYSAKVSRKSHVLLNKNEMHDDLMNKRESVPDCWITDEGMAS